MGKQVNLDFANLNKYELRKACRAARSERRDDPHAAAARLTTPELHHSAQRADARFTRAFCFVKSARLGFARSSLRPQLRVQLPRTYANRV